MIKVYYVRINSCVSARVIGLHEELEPADY